MVTSYNLSSVIQIWSSRWAPPRDRSDPRRARARGRAIRARRGRRACPPRADHPRYASPSATTTPSRTERTEASRRRRADDITHPTCSLREEGPAMRPLLPAWMLCGLTAARAAVFDVTKYGAKGDNATDDTAGVRAAFAAASRAGGGTVLFPTGKTFLTGPMNVSSHTGEISDFLCGCCCVPVILALVLCVCRGGNRGWRDAIWPCEGRLAYHRPEAGMAAVRQWRRLLSALRSTLLRPDAPAVRVLLEYDQCHGAWRR